MMKRTIVLLLLFTLLVAGCGGALERRKQQVTIGVTPNQEVTLQPGGRLSLNASAKAIDEPLTAMSWSIEAITPPASGPAPQIANANCATVTLTIKDQDGRGQCTAELSVPTTSESGVWRIAAMAESESKGTASAAFVLKVVAPERDTGNFRIEAPTLLTVDEAGEVLVTNTLVTINAEALSEKPMRELRYEWTAIASPDANLRLAGVNTQRLQFIPRAAGDYQFRVTATAQIDGREEMVTAEVLVIVEDSDRRDELVVFAGVVQPKVSRELVNLTGSVTYNGQAVSNVSYAWVQISGPTVALADATTAAPSFFAPVVAADTELVFELRASAMIEGRSVSGTSRTVVRVEPEPEE